MAAPIIFALEYNICILQYILNNQYINNTIKNVTRGIESGDDGLVDSVRLLLFDHEAHTSREASCSLTQRVVIICILFADIIFSYHIRVMIVLLTILFRHVYILFGCK